MTALRHLALLAIAYGATLIAGFLLYVGLIASPLLSSIPLLFYRGIAIAFVTLPLLAGVLAITRRWIRALDLSTIVGAVALSLAFNITFLVVFPVTFDRSITMFLLARIEAQNGRLDAPALERIFVAEYLGSMRQIDRRVEEQSLSGNIVVQSGRIYLTPQGRRLMSEARRIGGWFGADPRFVAAAAQHGPAAPAPPQH